MAEPLRIQQIRQFVITANSGSFRAAATGTFRSQAAVSAAMHDLERQIGAKLFDQGRRARLTPLAQTLLPSFSELLVTHDRVLREARQLAQAERGSVSLAVVPVLAEEWLPSFLADFTRKFPGVRIRATDQRSPQVRAMVADGLVDVGIAGHLPTIQSSPSSRLYRLVWGAMPARSPVCQAAQVDPLERVGR